MDDCISAPSDHELLRMHVEMRSEESFRALMARYVDLVYSSAMRQVGNHATAEDITQAVFTVLARKAASLTRETVLAGWLVRAARYAALDALKLEARRAQRERAAAELEEPMTQPPEAEAGWEQMAPHLDEALSQLSRCDRNAVVLRFFEKRSWREVGETLGSNENAARVRVGRAVEKLRSYFRKRGVAVSSASLTAALLANSVQAAPAGLLAGATFGHTPLVALLLRRLFWPKIVTGATIVLLLLVGLVAWRLWPAAANTVVAAPPPPLDTNQQAAIAREARAVVNQIDRGLFFNDPQTFVGQINFRSPDEERYRPLLLEYARVSNEFRSALATASPTGRAPSRSYRVILEEIFEGQPAPAPVVLTRTYATDNAFKSHGIHLVKTNGAWKWNFFAPFSPEARAHRMAVLEKKTAVMKSLLPSLRERSLTNAYEALDQFKLATP
jgi:RNA polymerase sigma factor (sigma-70 family)